MRGTIQLGVRWKRLTCEAISATSGTSCTALAAEPITPTVSPLRSWSQSHRAEWMVLPSKESKPSMPGRGTSLNMPRALITTSAVTSAPDSVVSVQVASSSSQRAEITASLNRQWGSTPYLSAQCSM